MMMRPGEHVQQALLHLEAMEKHPESTMVYVRLRLAEVHLDAARTLAMLTPIVTMANPS